MNEIPAAGNAALSRAVERPENADVCQPAAPPFTPAPWVEVPQSQGGPMIAHPFETGNQMNPTGLRLICHVLQRRDSLRMDQANAKLLAAAPDLYAALKSARGWIGQDDSVSDDPLAHLTAIDAALAKAEGRTP